jgi:hypothetical protein
LGVFVLLFDPLAGFPAISILKPTVWVGNLDTMDCLLHDTLAAEKRDKQQKTKTFGKAATEIIFRSAGHFNSSLFWLNLDEFPHF